MERVATGWLALDAGGGALGVGIVLAARTLPSLLFGLAAGALADRLERRRILMGVSLAGVLLAISLGLLVGTGSVALWQVAAIAFLSGSIQVSDQPARQALVFDTVGRASAPNAIALNAVATRLFGAVGAFAGGLIIPAFGIANCYFVVAAAYLLALAILAGLRVRASEHAVAAPPPFGRALAEAGRLMVERPAVRTLVLAATTCEIFAFSYMTAVPTFARDVLQAGAEGLGTLTAASSIGATLVVVVLSGLPAGVRREPLLTGVYLLYGASILAFAVAPSLLVAAVVMLVIGSCASAFDVLQQTMIQLAVPEDQRGRAVGIWVFSIGSAPLGHLEVGALAGALGAPPALLINGVCVVAGALILLTRSPAFRFGRTGLAAPATSDPR
jgi:predicted MFS family arabinose efflux permease